MARRVRARVIREAAELDRYASSWRTLEPNATMPTQHFAWARTGARAFGTLGRLHVVTVGEGDACTAVAPLVRTTGWSPRLELLGMAGLFEPMDFLAADAASLDRLAEGLARQRTPLLLGRVPASSPTIPALERAYSRRGWIRTAPGAPYPYVDVGPGWTEAAHFNSGRRSDFRRAARHAEEHGKVTYEILTPTPAEVGPLLDEAFAVEAKSWKGEVGSALAIDPMLGAFFRDYAAAAAAAGILRIAFMRIAGQAVAMQIAVECHNRFWLFKIGYDDQHGKASPGALLMLHTLNHAAARGLASYEFLGGAAPWTAAWTKQLRACVVIRAYPISVSGAVGLGRDVAHWAVVRAKKRMQREPVRT